MLKLRTNTRDLDVVVNNDGTITITCEGKPINNPGQFILQMGGIDAVLARCKEYTEAEWQAELEREKSAKLAAKEAARQRCEQLIKEHELAYHEVFGNEDVVETTPRNIYILLSYLNDFNWGSWKLPKMSIGYRCNQYDCDGKQATTITLDKAIDYDGRPTRCFEVGAPVRHLMRYQKLSY